MKYIRNIDDYNVRTFVGSQSRSVIARPEQGYGFLWLEIRLRMAWACLIGKADAVTFISSLDKPDK